MSYLQNPQPHAQQYPAQLDQQAYEPPQQYQQNPYDGGKQSVADPLLGQAVAPLVHDGKYTIKYQGTFAAVECAISPTDGIKAEAGVMITLSDNVDIEAKIEGNLAQAFCLGCCTNESFFFSHFTLHPGKPGSGGSVLVAPSVPGEIVCLHLDGSTQWAIQKGGFLACDSTVQIGTLAQGFVKGCCSGLGFFLIEASGHGNLLLSAYGSLIRYDVAPGEVRTVDNGFVVAWTTSMNYEVGKAASTYSASFLSGEGFVSRFTGPGTVYVQTRSLKGLANALRPYMPSGGGSGGSG